MVILETSIFTRRITAFLADDEVRRLQAALVLRPAQGTLIPGTHGLRKLRWRLRGRGKRGGLRVIYYWDESGDRILMIFVYAKTRQSDLSQAQLRQLAQVVREEFR
jgi:mRNA-degrading endonuclease RelE of RelBE toxin-antitoxin system